MSRWKPFLILAVALLGRPALSAPVARPAAVEPSRPESRFVTLVNEDRARHGLRPLAWDNALCVASRQHSREMAEMDYFDHTSPVEGWETPADRWERCVARPPATYTIGENLFYGSAPDVAWGHRSLMQSEHHRRNILNPTYTRIGVGVHIARNGEMWVTEMFFSP